MDLVVSLLAWVVFVFSWVVINGKMKSKSSAIKRHVAGFLGGASSFIIIVVMALLTGVIDSQENTRVTDPIKNNGAGKLSFREMMIDRNDFSVDAGTLKIISYSPLEVVLFARDAITQTRDIKKENVNRAAIYGVYRTFIHTDEPSITLTAYPLDIKSINPLIVEENKSIEVNLSVTREQALKVIKRLLPEVESYDDITEEIMVGDMKLDDEWTQAFSELYWKRQGQERLISELDNADIK